LREAEFDYYLMSLFFIMFIDSTKKKGVVIRNQARFSSNVMLNPPVVSARVSVTECVNGKKMFAKVCSSTGRAVSGKNVPLSMNIGVMNKKAG
jgi:hypothetical protein